MAIKVINKNGKRIPNRKLPKLFAGERVPYFEHEYLAVGKAHCDSMWRTIHIDELCHGNFKVYRLVSNILYVA